MTIYLHWWYLPIVLIVVPLVYARFRTSGGNWDMQIDTMLIAAVCWFGAVGIVIGHWL